jgi:hypothetical protein
MEYVESSEVIMGGHRGAPFEYTVAKKYQKLGYRVQRAYMSLGIWDLMCIMKVDLDRGAAYFKNTFSHVIYVQVKGKESDPFTDEDKKALKDYAEEVGAQGHYAYGKRMPLKKKKPGSRQRLQKNRTVVIENLSEPKLLGSSLVDLPD